MNPILRYIWNRFKAQFLKFHFDETARNSKYELEWAHTDSKGRTYSRFIKPDLPLERLGKMQDFMDLMGSGLSRDELKELITAADNELAMAMAGKKASMSVVGWTLQEILKREESILHTELLYNFLAVQYVREDEPVNEYVEAIQLEKIAQFKEDNKDSSTYFFFRVPELKMVNEYLKFTEQEWNDCWSDSLKEQSRLKKQLQALDSVKRSSKGTATPVRT